VSAVETLLFRARRALREQLEGALSCSEAELALSKQLDGRLPKAEDGTLRAHLRSCPDCARLARRLRAQRSAIRGLWFPLPASLVGWGTVSSVGGGGAATVTAAAGVGTKVAALVTAGGLIAGAGYGVEEWQPWVPAGPTAADAAAGKGPGWHAGQFQSFAGLEKLLQRARSAPRPVPRQIPTPLGSAQRAHAAVRRASPAARPPRPQSHAPARKIVPRPTPEPVRAAVVQHTVPRAVPAAVARVERKAAPAPRTRRQATKRGSAERVAVPVVAHEAEKQLGETNRESRQRHARRDDVRTVVLEAAAQFGRAAKKAPRRHEVPAAPAPAPAPAEQPAAAAAPAETQPAPAPQPAAPEPAPAPEQEPPAETTPAPAAADDVDEDEDGDHQGSHHHDGGGDRQDDGDDHHDGDGDHHGGGDGHDDHGD
jgi:hypothetical protein